MLWNALLIALLGVAGGIPPLLLRRTDRVLHLLIALATGIFLGSVFLHLLPGVAALARHPHGDAAGDETADGLLWLCVLGGVLGLYLLQNLALRQAGSGDRAQHVAVGWASLLGLSIHALTAGAGLAAATAADAQDLAGPLLLAILSHKIAESFSLSTVFLLASFPRARILWIVLGFSLLTPLGLALGTWVVGSMESSAVEVLSALAAGTFLFVAIGDLLPEVFHHRDDVLAKVALLAVGILGSYFAHELGGHGALP